MKPKNNLYAPLFFGAVLILTGLSSLIFDLIERLPEGTFLAGTIVQLLVYLLPFSFYLRVRSLNVMDTVKIRYVSTKKIPFIFVMILLLFTGILVFRYLGLFIFPTAFLETPGIVSSPSGGSNGFLIFVCSVILPAVLEEAVFRGVLLEEYRIYGPFHAVAISSLMYAMAHLSPENFVYYLFVGFILGIIAVSSDSLVPSALIHMGILYSHSNFRPVVVEYLRQAGKSSLLLYLLLTVFLILVVMMFARLENIYRDRSYEELLQSRKELLMREVEKTRGLATGEPEVKNPLLTVLKDMYLSPTFLAATAIFIALLFEIFR